MKPKNTNRGNIVKWLREQIALVNIPNCDIWLFGSIASNQSNPKDCDLLLIAPTCDLELKFEMIKDVEDRFMEFFDFPLHLTVISTEERADFQSFLKEVFQKPHIQF